MVVERRRLRRRAPTRLNESHTKSIPCVFAYHQGQKSLYGRLMFCLLRLVAALSRLVTESSYYLSAGQQTDWEGEQQNDARKRSHRSGVAQKVVILGENEDDRLIARFRRVRDGI